VSSKSSLYGRIAADMQDVAQVQQAVERQGAGWPDAATRADSGLTGPRTPTEKWLAGMWAEVLKREQVDVNADFFELGGDSLAAMRILARVREQFAVTLPPATLFTVDFTVAEIAKAIDQYLIAGADEQDVAAALEELEGLSDAEARAMLASEG